MTLRQEAEHERIEEEDRDVTRAIQRWVLIRAALGRPVDPDCVRALVRAGLLIPQVAYFAAEGDPFP